MAVNQRALYWYLESSALNFKEITDNEEEVWEITNGQLTSYGWQVNAISNLKAYKSWHVNTLRTGFPFPVSAKRSL